MISRKQNTQEIIRYEQIPRILSTKIHSKNNLSGPIIT